MSVMKRKTSKRQNQLTTLHPQHLARIIQMARFVTKHWNSFGRSFWLNDPDPERVDTMVAGIMGVYRRTVATLEDHLTQGAQL